jgi:hypothetical protein
VVDGFMAFEGASEVASHNETMFEDVAAAVPHLGKRFIGIEMNRHIAATGLCPTTLQAAPSSIPSTVAA